MNHVELSPEEKALIAAARTGDGPSEVQRARVRRGLGAKLAAGAALPVLAGSSAMAMAGKIGAGVVLVASLGAGTAYWTIARPTGDSAPSPAQPATRPSPTVAPSPAAIAAPTADTPPTAPLVPAEPHAAPVLRPTPRGKANPSRREPSPAHAPVLAEEILLLTQANAALKRGDPTRAGALLGAYDQRFPRGKLAEERAAAEILLLCASGRVPDARAKARDFVARWPRSPLLVPLQRSCAPTGSAP